ncbi:MAG: Mov34/MPN/PAD-1 family protein [Candidatus Odinarchaeia archaeon]
MREEEPKPIVRLNKKLIIHLVEEAKKNQPVETLAVLFGEHKDVVYVVKEAIFLENTTTSTTMFNVNVEELNKVYLEGERKGLQVVGIFHSHPKTTYPSAIDIKYMRLNPVPWLILSGKGEKEVLRAFILKDNKPYELLVEVD